MPKLSTYFFPVTWVYKHIAMPFGWLFPMMIIFYVPFLRPWWWFFAPIFLVREVRVLYLWWINWDYYYAKVKWQVLEIVPPKEVLTPLKAMEDVFTVLWNSLYNPPNWRERWCEGVIAQNPDNMSFEVVSIEGALHFYIRVNSNHRTTLETALYSHYPELEIREVLDYVKNVPQNIPNEEWDVYGEDFILAKEAYLPIKTYEKFFEPAGEKIAAEEKRLDPMASLLELMSKLGPGEQYWMQFTLSSMAPDDNAWREEGKEAAHILAKRPVSKPITLGEELMVVFWNILLGPRKKAGKEGYEWMEVARSEEDTRELLLTPGERELLTEVENKLKRPTFRAIMRGVYVAKRENFKSAHRVLARSYFAHFHTQNMNLIKFSGVTRPKTQYVFRKRIPFIRTRRIFRNAVLRFPPLFPERLRETAILTPEEMATIFHFPIKITGLVSPTLARVESKKSGPPPNLPT